MATKWTYDHWEKEKQNLKLVGEDGRTYSYNFATRAWMGLSGKRLSRIPNFVKESCAYCSVLLAVIENKMEWALSYPELLPASESTLIDYDYFKESIRQDFKKGKNLKGYIPYLHKMEKKISLKTYVEFLFSQKFEDCINYRWFENVPESFLIGCLSRPSGTLKKFYKIQLLTVKNGRNFTLWSGYWLSLFDGNEFGYVPDCDKDFFENREYREELEKEFTEKELVKKLQCFSNYRNHIELNEDYEIVFPSSLRDLIEEGKRQNNCVGKLYNNYMREGRGICFFIRKKTGKSHITCRYDFQEDKLVEARLSCNRKIDDVKEQTYVKKAEKIVYQIVSELKEKGVI